MKSYLPVRRWIKVTGSTVNALQHHVLNGGHVFPFDVSYIPWDQGSLMFDTCPGTRACISL